MTADEYQPVRVSRRIEAPPADIFRVLADPQRHLEIDGSGMLRGAVSDAVVTGVDSSEEMIAAARRDLEPSPAAEGSADDAGEIEHEPQLEPDHEAR